MRKYFCVSIIILVGLFLPIFISADGGMIIWPPDVYLDQSAQNAICAWNGSKEIIILSNDIQSDAQATILRILSLPSNPDDIKEGNFKSFEKLVEIMNEKLEVIREEFISGGKKVAAPAAGVEITFHEQIGAHDVTVVKVNDLDDFLNWIKDFAQEKELAVKEISQSFKQGVKNYLQRDIRYFVFDVIDAGQEQKSIEPLVYRFDSDYLFYPLLMTGISEIGQSEAEINLFLVVKKDAQWPKLSYTRTGYAWFSNYGYPVELSQQELEEISGDIAFLFENGATASKTSLYSRFNQVGRDLMVFPDWIWDKNLTFGTRSEAIRTLQKALINEGVWDSDVEATGYFGPITKSALVKFQEKYAQDILGPQNLETETGIFDTKTKDYFKRLSIEIEEVAAEITWERDLIVGMGGDDVKALQEILISEGVWNRPDIGATGYFGPITQQALIAFQEKYASKILEPLGLKKGTGYFGPFSRNFLNQR